MSTKLHIRVDIEYDLHGDSIESMKELADRAIMTLFGSGAFTDTTYAEIKEWHCHIAPPRDKYVAVVLGADDGVEVFGAYDGADAAAAAFTGRKSVIVPLTPITKRPKP